VKQSVRASSKTHLRPVTIACIQGPFGRRASDITYKRMGIIAFLVLGGVAGWIASLIVGTDESQGIFANIAVGVVGALIGGLVFNMFGTAGVTGFNLYSLLVATLGAVLALWLLRMVRTT
jgi:uncharacterized membrane protein YeaQ/YmgE (transglycosylase-associated protein family)